MKTFKKWTKKIGYINPFHNALPEWFIKAAEEGAGEDELKKGIIDSCGSLFKKKNAKTAKEFSEIMLLLYKELYNG